VLLGSATLFAGGTKEAAQPTGPVTITLWTKEGEADGTLQWIQGLAAKFTQANPLITMEIVNKDVEALREDFQTASLAGTAPDLLWTVSDHAGPFVTADLIMPVDKLVDMRKYVESVEMDGQTWAVPISAGNHLMLLYNKDLVTKAPETVDELVRVAKGLTQGGTYGLVWNMTEPFWLVPWLGAFGGSVFAADGVTPTLNTDAMVKALTLLSGFKNVDKITPAEADYNGADTLFKEGKAGFIINGDWSLGGYKEVLGDKLGVARMPRVAGGSFPKPYTAGAYFMVPRDLAKEKQGAVARYIQYMTSPEVQGEMIAKLARLPGLRAAMTNPAIANDPVLKGSTQQLAEGVPQPTVLEMRCNWDSMKPELIQVLAGTKTPKDAAEAMQAAGAACVADL
jgi:arabinogalactan oligomer/maltooligosaccharide transport system substrate-binding protein